MAKQKLQVKNILKIHKDGRSNGNGKHDWESNFAVDDTMHKIDMNRAKEA